MKTLSHVASRFVGTPLMIHPPKLEVIIKALEPRLGLLVEENETVDNESESRLKASYRSSRGEPERSYAVLEGGVAVIPVQGTLLKRSSWLSAMSGCCSYLDIQDQLTEAMADGGVASVLLDIDSPGGEVSGCFELSDFIYSLRNEKPIYAAANDYALSAAYAIASAAEKIFVTRTGAVGSVGVYALHVDQAEFDKKVGVKYNYIFAGDKKVDGNPHQPLSERAQNDIQAEVDREYEMFTALVARNRRVVQKDVVATQAGLLFADGSLGLLADEVGTFEDAVAELVNKSSKNAASAAISTRGESGMAKPNAEENTTATLGEKPENGTEETEPKEGKGEKTEMDPEDPNCKEGKQAAAATLVASPGRSEEEIVAISNLCKMAGKMNLLSEFLTKKNAAGTFVSVAEVSEELTQARVAESEKHMINSQIDPTHSNAEVTVERLETQAATFASQNRTTVMGKLYVEGTRKGITREQATAQLLEEHPEAYAKFRQHHNAKGLIRTLENAGYKLAAR